MANQPDCLTGNSESRAYDELVKENKNLIIALEHERKNTLQAQVEADKAHSMLSKTISDLRLCQARAAEASAEAEAKASRIVELQGAQAALQASQTETTERVRELQSDISNMHGAYEHVQSSNREFDQQLVALQSAHSVTQQHLDAAQVAVRVSDATIADLRIELQLCSNLKDDITKQLYANCEEFEEAKVSAAAATSARDAQIQTLLAEQQVLQDRLVASNALLAENAVLVSELEKANHTVITLRQGKHVAESELAEEVKKRTDIELKLTKALADLEALQLRFRDTKRDETRIKEEYASTLVATALEAQAADVRGQASQIEVERHTFLFGNRHQIHHLANYYYFLVFSFQLGLFIGITLLALNYNVPRP